MNTIFNAKATAKEILSNLTTLKVSTGVKVQIGRVGSTMQTIEITNSFKGYDAVRKSINRQTERMYGEDCVLKIGDVTIPFKGGKFSNELLKMLERCTTEYFNNGDFLNEYADFKQNLSLVKNTFISENITIVDLVPIAAQFVGLDRKQLATVGFELANHDNFVVAIEEYREGVRLIEEAEAKFLEEQNNA